MNNNIITQSPQKSSISASICSICQSKPQLLAFYNGKPYCLACLVIEYPKIGDEVFHYLKDYLGLGVKSHILHDGEVIKLPKNGTSKRGE